MIGESVPYPFTEKEMRMAEWVYRTDWRNIGAWVSLNSFHPDAGIRTPWGNIIVKRWKDRLFSERYGHSPHLRLFGLCVSWVRLRHYPDLSAAILDITPLPTALFEHADKDTPSHG